jgi:integration host factor subunit beta
LSFDFNRVSVLRGFGVFAIKLRQARRGRNPRSGATVSVPEKAIPFFKTGEPMHERLNPSRAGEGSEADPQPALASG